MEPTEERGAAVARGAGTSVRLLFALAGASTAALLPFFALLLRDRGLRPDAIGLILAVQSLVAVVSAPAWSHVADTRLGTVRTLQVSSLASAVAALALVATGSSVWALVAVAAVLGGASAPGTALSDTLALGHLGPERMTEYGSIRLWASIGWAVGVVAFGWWFERAGLGPVPVAYAVGTLAFVAVTTRFSAVRPETQPKGSRLGSVGEVFRAVPRLTPFLAGLVLVTMATSAGWSFVPLRIASRGGGPFLVGLAASVAAVVEIPVMLASGRLAERVGLRALFALGCAIYVAILSAWAVVADPVMVAVIKMVGGAGFGLLYVSLVVITGRLVPERLRNSGQALMQTFGAGIGPILGSAIGGVIYRRLGAPTLFAGAAALTVIGAAVVWRALSGRGLSAAARAHPGLG